MDVSARESAIDFVERNLIGRTVVAAPVVTRTNDGRTEASYVDESLYSNLVRTAFGFGFDITNITVGRRYTLDENGQRTELAGTLDAVRVYRYEMTERPSSGRLLGFARFISSTNTEFDPLEGCVFLVQMSVDADELVVEEQQQGYGDFVEPGGARRAVACDFSYRYALRDDQLVVTFRQQTYDVDPETLERRKSRDEFPVQTSREFVLAG